MRSTRWNSSMLTLSSVAPMPAGEQPWTKAGTPRRPPETGIRSAQTDDRLRCDCARSGTGVSHQVAQHFVFGVRPVGLDVSRVQLLEPDFRETFHDRCHLLFHVRPGYPHRQPEVDVQHALRREHVDCDTTTQGSDIHRYAAHHVRRPCPERGFDRGPHLRAIERFRDHSGSAGAIDSIVSSSRTRRTASRFALAPVCG